MGSPVPRTPGFNPAAFATYDPNNPPMFSQAPGLSPLPPRAPKASDYYQGIDPQTMGAWAELEGLSPEKDRIARQLALADKLRTGAPGLAKSQSQINTPNWAGALASMFQGYQAGQYDRQANADLGSYAGKRADIVRKYFGIGKDTPIAPAAPAGE